MNRTKIAGVISIITGITLCSFDFGSAVVLQDGTQIKPAPKKFPQGYFVEPTDSALNIAGNFGEIRPNHFHAGLDVKTGGREGLMIYAAADGYVSRVKISAFGYGKAIYITHPNGFVTVYAHLQRLHGKIAEYVRNEQYKFETFEIDINVPRDVLRVNQCDTIAVSGNTGGSQSPHLHFEIRDEKTEHAYNPFLFGYKIKDTVPPVISLLKIYPVTDSSAINGLNKEKKTGVVGRRGKYSIPGQPILLSGDIGFGIETVDYANIKEAGKLGAYSIDLYVDGQRLYYHELNDIAFDESRYINSHIDYEESGKSGRQVQQCFRDKNNMLSIYQCVLNEGLYRFDDTATHTVKFLVKDFFGNTSQLSFKVKSQKHVVRGAEPSKVNSQPTRNPEPGTALRWDCSQENKFETGDVQINIGPCGLYQDLDFNYKKSKDTLPGTFAPVHDICDDAIPLHTPMSLSIKTKPIPAKYQTKATIVWLDAKNGKVDQKGSIYTEGADGAGWVTTQTKSFGRFTVALDTVAPSIKPYNIYFGKNMSRAKTISMIIGDNLSGIKSYRATIDGKWVLMEYEYKKAMLFYEFGEEVEKGKHVFAVEVTDGKGNSRSYKTEFVR